MRKKILFGMIIMVIIIAVLFFIRNHSSSQQKIFNEVTNNYGKIIESVDALLKYEPGYWFYITDDNDVNENLELVKGEVYMEYSLEETNNVSTIISEPIKKSLELQYIDIIRRNERTIDFEWDDSVLDNRDNGAGFGGFYYSLNGKPQTPYILEDAELKKDGEGWSYTDGQELNKYYTQKIKEQIYYYEGVFYP